MQIAGRQCERCGRTIVFADDGKGCSHCRLFVHLACDSRSVCAVCSGPYEGEETIAPDPTGDAILPPALRPGASGLPRSVLISLAVVATLIVLVLSALPCGPFG